MEPGGVHLIFNSKRRDDDSRESVWMPIKFLEMDDRQWELELKQMKLEVEEETKSEEERVRKLQIQSKKNLIQKLQTEVDATEMM